MSAPSTTVIAERLRKLQREAAGFKSKPFYFSDSSEFDAWKQEAYRWLDHAGVYAEGHSIALIVWRSGRGDLPAAWQAALTKAERVLGAVIENLENDWSGSHSPEPAQRVMTPHQPAVQIVNTNLQVNLDITLSQILERLCEQGEKESPEKRGWFKKLRELIDSPTAKDYFGKTIEAILKSQTK